MKPLIKNTLLALSGTLIGGTIAAIISNSTAQLSSSLEASPSSSEQPAHIAQPKRFTQTRPKTTNSSSQSITTINKILTEPNLAKRRIKLNEYIKSLNTDQIKAILKENARLGHRHNFSQAIKYSTSNLLLLQSWIESQPEEAFNFIRKNRSIGYFSMGESIDKWFEKNPEKALNYFKNIPFPTYEESKAILSYYAKNNVNAGEEWLKNAKTKYKDGFLSEFYAEAFKDLPLQEASSKIKALNLKERRITDAFEELAGKWVKKDWDATKAWIDTLPDEQKNATFAHALSQLAQQDFMKAKELFPQSYDEKDKYRYLSAIYSISSQEALKNPEAAMDWVTKQTEKIGYHNYPIESVMKGWASKSPEEAKEWLSKQPEGTNKELATLAYLSQIKKLPHEEKLSMLTSIANQKNYQWREEMGKALKSLNNQNKEAAETWLNNSTFTDDLKKDLQNKMAPTKTIYDLKNSPDESHNSDQNQEVIILN